MYTISIFLFYILLILDAPACLRAHSCPLPPPPAAAVVVVVFVYCACRAADEEAACDDGQLLDRDEADGEGPPRRSGQEDLDDDGPARGRGEDGLAGPQTVEDVYVEAMSLDAEGRVSGQSSAEWRRQLDDIIDVMRHQVLIRAGAGVARAKLHLLADDDVDEAAVFTPPTRQTRTVRR